MAALNAFKNCSNFTDEETRVIALVRGVSAAVCCGILSFVLVALVVLAKPPKARKRLCGTVIKRLTFGTFAVSVAYQLNFALHLVHYYYQDNRYCKVNGFFNQYFGSVLLLFILESILILYFKIMAKVIPSWRTLYKAKKNAFTYHGWKINKLEVLNLALIVVLPLVIGYLSLQTNMINLEHGAGLSYLIHTHGRIVGTDLAVVYPFWSCCFSDSCTLYYITVYVCVGPRICMESKNM